MAPAPVALAVAGAGRIGRRHVELINANPGATLAAVVDPDPAARDLARSLGVPWHGDLDGLLAGPPARPRPEGVILATPNPLHLEHGLACAAAGVPALVEKPIATDTAAARRLVEAFAAAGLPLLVGHHRRHNPLIMAAKACLVRGDLGTLTTVHAMAWLPKPDSYFDADWRRRPGAGPVLVNLIHDIDLLRHLCGEVVWLQAVESSARRGFAVEDTAALVLRFAGGVVGTVSLSDTVVGPWSWELTAGENPDYPKTDATCYWIGGTHGSLELPNGRLWRGVGPRDWFSPLTCDLLDVAPQDPLVRQLDHFCRVVRGQEAPLVSGEEGLRTLRVIEAAKQSARTGAPVTV
ncbi:MAG: Gfo/Idh/MocA family oxidoreductase [Rhodobacterales bacterium]|nr:Gfo/Idh/MocA family oxidoreductase [Rhodobacterales bacterium]